MAYDLAADFVWRQDRNELDRLELRDLAIREGWYRSERYRQELRRLRKEAPDLRAEVGDEIYDRYLFASGRDNRVHVTSVISDSPADAAGIRPGDIVETYGGERIFNQAELRGATTDGELGELVPLQLRRANGARVQVWLPRGPLGIRMGLTHLDPEG
jgi:C-terminal processing protease CtpA/Prc